MIVCFGNFWEVIFKVFEIFEFLGEEEGYEVDDEVEIIKEKKEGGVIKIEKFIILMGMLVILYGRIKMKYFFCFLV